MPISNKTRAFGVTPMEHGLRVAGTVEIAGLEAPPNEARATVLLEHIKGMFPDVERGNTACGWDFVPRRPTVCRSSARCPDARGYSLRWAMAISA